nr:serine/arginine repetitive matrix protein 1-like isoform X1 [Ipomoea trifida]
MGLSDNGKLGHDDEYPYEDHDDGHFEVHRPNWDSRASWMSRDDSPPRHNGQSFEANHPDGGTKSTYTIYDSPSNKLMSQMEASMPGDGGLKENLDSLGKVKDFFNQVQMEASMPGDPVLSRGGHNLGANPNWVSQNGAPGRGNWGSRGSWMSRDDSPPRHNGRPNGGTGSTYTTYDDSPRRYYQRNELSRSSLDTKPNWPSRSQSPPMMQSRLVSYPNYGTRPKWPSSRDDSPPRVMAHPNSGARPNWPIRNDSSSRVMEYYELHDNSNTRPLAKARDDSPPRAMEYYEAHPKFNSSEDAVRVYGGTFLPCDYGGGDCVVNQHAIQSMEARRRHLTKVERSPNTISRPSSGLLRWVVKRRNKRRQTIEANPKASN